jgi:tetratricopeptide (TPR) repeat protein
VSPPHTGSSEASSDPSRAFTSVPLHTLLLGVLAVVGLVFLPSLFFGFVYDDHWTLVGNGFLRSPEDLGLLLRAEAVERNVPDAFRPTLVLFDLATYQLFGTRPLPHHALSIGLYLCICVLLERWLFGLGAPVAVRITTVGLWGVLAIHAEVVAVVSYREDLLAALFGLGALVLADRALESSRPRAVLLSLAAGAAMLAATGAKLSAAPLPLVWLLARLLSPWTRVPLAPRSSSCARRGRTWLVAVVLVLGVAAVMLHRLSLYGDLSPYEGEHDPHLHAHRIGTSSVLAASAQIHLGYLAQMLTGAGLSPEYVDFGAAWSDPATMLATASLVGLLAYGLFGALTRRRPVAALAILGAFVLAIPTSNAIPMPNMRADRFMLLPSVPVVLGVATMALALGHRLAARTRRPAWTFAPVIGFAIVQGALAQAATTVYRSDSRLWEIARRRAPHSARAQAISGEILIARMQGSEALAADPAIRARASAHCANAVRIDPLYDVAHLCRARLAALDRRWLEATGHFTRALELVPRREDRVLVALASVTLDRPDLSYPQRVERAFAYLDRALREYPYVAEVAAAAARIEHRLGRPQRAASHLRRASKLHPERWDLVLAGLELLLDIGHASAARRAHDEAEDLLREAAPSRREAFLRRLSDAERLFDPSPFDPDPRLESPFHDP